MRRSRFHGLRPGAAARLRPWPSARSARCCCFLSCATWLGAGSGRPAVFDLADRLGPSQAARGSPAALQPEHLPPASVHADLLRLDAPSGADDRAAARARPAPGDRLQRGARLQLRRLGVRDVPARRAPDRIAGRRLCLRAAVRVLSLPLRALQPFRAADDLLHAARAAGPAPLPDHGARAGRRRGRRAGGRPVVFLDVLRRVLHVLRRRAPADPRPPRPVRACERSWSRRRSRARSRCCSPGRSRDLQRGASRGPRGADRVVLQRHRRPTTSGRIRAAPCGRIAGCRGAARNAPCSPASWRCCWRRSRSSRPSAPTRAAYAGALLVAFEISRGFNGPVYPYLYEWLPFVRGLRVPARSSLLVGLSLALLAGFGVRRLLAGRSRPADSRRAGCR